MERIKRLTAPTPAIARPSKAPETVEVPSTRPDTPISIPRDLGADFDAVSESQAPAHQDSSLVFANGCEPEGPLDIWIPIQASPADPPAHKRLRLETDPSRIYIELFASQFAEIIGSSYV